MVITIMIANETLRLTMIAAEEKIGNAPLKKQSGIKWLLQL